jgi:hypothetical protein
MTNLQEALMNRIEKYANMANMDEATLKKIEALKTALKETEEIQ